MKKYHDMVAMWYTLKESHKALEEIYKETALLHKQIQEVESDEDEDQFALKESKFYITEAEGNMKRALSSLDSCRLNFRNLKISQNKKEFSDRGRELPMKTMEEETPVQHQKFGEF